MNQPLVITLCYIRELPFAKILFDSLKKFEPSLPFLAIMIDDKKNLPTNTSFDFELRWLADLNIKESSELASKYNWNELKNNHKPFVINQLLKENSSIIYLDCTSKLYAPLSELKENLAKNSAILVPQFVSARPLEAENDALNKGIFHNGLMAFRSCDATSKLLIWWQNHTLNKGFDNVCVGMNTDRLCLEFAPIFFDDVYVLKHVGYNVGQWNENERGLQRDSSGNFSLRNSSLVTYNSLTDTRPRYEKEFLSFSSISPAYGIPVKTLSTSEKERVASLQSMLDKIDAFFDKF